MLKKHTTLTLFFCLLGLAANAQIVNIPDVNFKNALVNTKCVDTDGNGTVDIDADTNNDGEIQSSEALAVTGLDVFNRSIQSLEGIEAFTQLKVLSCNSNKLTKLNVQGLSSLKALSCNSNQLTTLDVQGLINLQKLICSYNQLTNLEVQGLTNLEALDCANNKLATLNVQGLSSMLSLRCNLNNLSALNVQDLINLVYFDCADNQITTLDLKGLIKLKIVYCGFNKLNTLTVQGLINLEQLEFYDNNLTAVNVQGLTNLKDLNCGGNKLTAVNVQGLTNLTSLNCFGNQIKSLNLKGLSKLRKLFCGNNPLIDIPVQDLTELETLDCSGINLKYLDVQGMKKLINLYCAFNLLTTLDVQGLSKLKTVICHDNKLITLYIKNGSVETSLNFSKNPQLSYICCDEGQLSTVQNQATQNGLTNCVISSSCLQIGAHIKGSIKQDLNLDCQADATETGMSVRVVKAEKTGSKPFYGVTNSAGHYEIVVDTGLYKLSVPNALSNNYYALCEDNIEVNLPKTEDSIRTDFLLTPVIFCPLLEVNIASARMRRCFENQYIVRYCNTGPVAAPNAQVTVTLSKDVQFVSSSIPGVNIGGRRWSFPLGEVASEDCGSFSINFLVLCDSTVLGQSICASAHITPDSICTPSNASWSGAEVVVDGYCEGDSVRFVIRNIGTGDMTETRRFIIVEDIVIFRTGDFNLQAGDSLVLKVRANGSTYRLEAEQEATHPFPSMPSATVEGCGQNLGGLFSLGFVSQFNEIDGNPFYSRDCREVVGSYDPNDKSAQPSGVDTPHYIEPNTSIDYLIRFQNTGTDTAFTVVIRDTLSPWLDMESFRAGISDHGYKVDIEKSNILKFTFNNILLPDSNVNEPASHGFVRFRITPKSSTPLGTKIENKAAIFFDFNAPIITNTVFHTVDTGFLKRKNLSVFSGKTPVQQQVYPNPVRSGELLYFEDIPEGQSRISLMDPLGKTAFVAQLKGNSLHLPADLLPGMYFLEWAGENGAKRWGKIWVTE